MEIDLNNLFNPKSLQEQASEEMIEKLKTDYDKMPEDAKLEIQEVLFMHVIEQIENSINSYILTEMAAWRDLKAEDIQAMLKRVEKRLVESEEREKAGKNEREYMKASIKNIGDLLLVHFKTHLHYLKNEQWKRK